MLIPDAAVEEDSDDSELEEEEDAKLPAREPHPMPTIEEDSEDNDENETPSPDTVARRPKRKRDKSIDPGLEKLKTARRDLQNDGKDPMQEVQRIAATATRSSPRNKLLDKKKSAARVHFGDSDEEESEDDDEGARAHLSEVPARARLETRKDKSPQKKAATGGMRKRVPFSEEEKTAIRRGVERFGIGKWSEIKSEYAVILRNRTSVNIKVSVCGCASVNDLNEYTRCSMSYLRLLLFQGLLSYHEEQGGTVKRGSNLVSGLWECMF